VFVSGPAIDRRREIDRQREIDRRR